MRFDYGLRLARRPQTACRDTSGSSPHISTESEFFILYLEADMLKLLPNTPCCLFSWSFKFYNRFCSVIEKTKLWVPVKQPIKFFMCTILRVSYIFNYF